MITGNVLREPYLHIPINPFHKSDTDMITNGSTRPKGPITTDTTTEEEEGEEEETNIGVTMTSRMETPTRTSRPISRGHSRQSPRRGRWSIGWTGEGVTTIDEIQEGGRCGLVETTQGNRWG